MLNKIPIHSVYIYLTERCNLKCDYCYFKDKRARTLEFSVIDAFIKYLKANLGSAPENFEISGGEALLCWPLVKKVILLIKSVYKTGKIGVQTNGLCLNREKIDFLKKNNIEVEIGIDGRYATTGAHRTGITKNNFQKLIDNIKICRGNNIPLSCTMTVHPDEVDKINENFDFLRKSGIGEIDITPAALVKWDEKDKMEFKERYSQLSGSYKDFSTLFTEEDTTFFNEPFLDLSLHPPHYVLCGDVFLCLSDELKNKYSILNVSGDLEMNRKNFLFFLKKYKYYASLIREPKTYRDFVSNGFKIIMDIGGHNYKYLKDAIEFNEFLKRVHLTNMSKKSFSAL